MFIDPFDNELRDSLRTFFRQEVPELVRDTFTPELSSSPIFPHAGYIVHSSEVGGRIDHHERNLDLLPLLLILLLFFRIHRCSRSVIGTGSRYTLRLVELMRIYRYGVVLPKLGSPFGVSTFGSLQHRLGVVAATHGFDQKRRSLSRQEGPMVIGHAGERMTESPPLLQSGDNVHEYRGVDAMRGVGVHDQTMADACATVVSTPDHRALFTEDLLESFNDQVSYGSLVVFGWKRAEAVAR